MTTTHPTTLLAMQQRTNFTVQPTPVITLDATVIHVELLCHVTGFTNAATMSMQFSIERSADSGGTWTTIFDSGLQAGGQTDEKTGVLGVLVLGMSQDVQPRDVGPNVQWRGRLTQVGKYSFDVVGSTTTEP